MLTIWLTLSRQAKQVVSSIPEVLKPEMTYVVVQAYPHDPRAFTQGLVYLDGWLYESTGRYGESSLRKVRLESGEVMQQTDLTEEYFAEGLVAWEDSLIQLTWKAGVGFIYDQESFVQTGQFAYETEGWGLTADGERLIMSDGTSTLHFLDPQSFQITGATRVTENGLDVVRINELEWVRGEVFANIWQTDTIIRIDPETGAVVGRIEMGGLLPPDQRAEMTDVLNGIAYDPAEDRLFVTGKYWPWLYEVRLVSIPPEN